MTTILPILISLLPAILAELAKTFPAAGAATPAATPTTLPAATTTLLTAQVAFIKQAQEILNAAQAAGLVSFGAALTADGIVGAKTSAAMQALMTKFNITA